MQNLRDKLLQAGLVTTEQAEKAEQTQQKPRPPPRDDRREGHGRPERGDRREAHGRPPPRGDRHESRGPSHAGRLPPRVEKAEPRIPKLPPLPGSREHQRLLAKKQVEIDRQLRELVHQNQVALEPGARTFYIVTRKGRLRRLELSEAQAALLEEGKLAVVERPEPAQIEHSLVPPSIAAQMKELYPKSVRFLNTPGEAVGFLSDADLETKKREEAELPPEAATGEGDPDREESA